MGVSDISVCICKDAVIPGPLPDGNVFSIDRARLKSYMVAFLRFAQTFPWSLELSRELTYSEEFGTGQHFNAVDIKIYFTPGS